MANKKVNEEMNNKEADINKVETDIEVIPGSVIVYNKNKEVVKVFSFAEHGDNYREKAKEYASQLPFGPFSLV